jgi:ketosteroid isomerase-like protein
MVEGTDDEATIVTPSSGESNSASPSSASSQQVPPYQPPGSYVSSSSHPGQGKRRTWPWILGIVALLLLLFAGLGIAAAFLIPKIVGTNANSNISNFNANVERRNNNSNPNLSNSNPNEGNANNNDDSLNTEDSTPPPTDEEAVLTDLTDLEHDWTVANINADKEKLDRILADDYAGTTSDGKPQGKAEYLRTIQRDTTIQKWNFEDLKASLKGDRASLTGTIRLVINDQEGQPQNVAYRFTDKFVWRDGRWQATGSEVTPIK